MNFSNFANFANLEGVPNFSCKEFAPKSAKYCLLIPIINENGRLQPQLQRALAANVQNVVDIIICDGGSTDGCTDFAMLTAFGVNTLLTKTGAGKQAAQLRMGLWWALQRGYSGFITVDGNNKDSIEDVPNFARKLDDGWDFVQGSRFVKDGVAKNTPKIRYFAMRLIHAPIISLTAKKRFTDSTNGFRAYSKKYITHPQVKPFRDIFVSYELLAYLSVRANQLGLATCEIPVRREYPKGKKPPTKIAGLRENCLLLRILWENLRGKYNA
ncbi:MAG: glycosyltransferase family 2 protein [Firmicutes bacterium]|nr:glycosyltransferase family 2 protein [Bacillota bacterium]